MRVTLAYPYEGHKAGTTVSVDETTARRLLHDGRARLAGPGGTDLDTLTMTELEAVAKSLRVDTTGLRRKAELRDAIQAAQANAATRTTILPPTN